MKNYRVWHIVNLDKEGVGKHNFLFYVDSPLEGARLINNIAELELIFPDSVIGSNVFGLEHLAGEDWEDWSSEEYEDVDELIDSIDDTESI